MSTACYDFANVTIAWSQPSATTGHPDIRVPRKRRGHQSRECDCETRRSKVDCDFMRRYFSHGVPCRELPSDSNTCVRMQPPAIARDAGAARSASAPVKREREGDRLYCLISQCGADGVSSSSRRGLRSTS